MKVIIMAGGRGTRISSIAPDIPKPLIKIDGVPVLEREIISLRDQGFTDIVLTVSHMANQIIDYFGNGEKLGVSINYFVEKEPLGNAGALFKMNLEGDFLLLNADSVFDIDFNRFVKFHREHNGLATIFTHPNSHPYDSGLVIANKDGQVTSWLTKEDKRPEWYKNRVNAGLHILNVEALKIIKEQLMAKGELPKKIDLDREVLKPLCKQGLVYCYDSPEYVKDMGTPERFHTVENDYKSGLVESKNLRNKQKVIFLDRDGTINKYVGFLTDIDQFELLPGVSDAIAMINKSGYLAIVASNQPVVARGEVTFDELDEIHNKMETLISKSGAYLDAIYYCPHHPDKGFEGEVPALKIDCDCRKPKPGLLLKAAEDYNIDLSQSYMVGDSKNDILAGKNAGCKTVLIGNEDYGQDYTVHSLLEFVESLLEGK